MPTDSDADANAGRKDGDRSSGDRPLVANPGYALGQIARSLAAGQAHEDPELRERARSRAETWSQVFEGMLAGTLAVGSRTPVGETPGWLTLEVVTGGFATGELLAGGPLHPHEEALLDGLGLPRDERARASLNAYWLGDSGQAKLRDLLRTGRYRVQVPEEGALLVVAWLLEHGQAEQARSVLDEIGPWLGRLRFYLVPHPRPLSTSSAVHVQTVGETLRDLAGVRERTAWLAERETLSIWVPLFDRMVALFLETVVGPVPVVECGADGRPARRADRSWALAGGWPCQRYPNAWWERASAWLADYRRLRDIHRRTRRPELPRKNFDQLRRGLERCVTDPKSLTGREVGRIRMILAQVNAKRGLPGSRRCRTLRQAQDHQSRQPTIHEMARVLADRLRSRPSAAPLEAVEPVLGPVTAEESLRFGVSASSDMPPRLRSVPWRCMEAPLEALVEQGTIASGEVLARVMPQLTAHVRASGFEDAALGRLQGAIYQAFRRRRSLLLLNLEKQIHIDELPWVSAVGPLRTDRSDARSAARELLEQVALVALTAFPQAILPNKLLQEIRALAERAGLALPIVDEVAADIFMGEFTEKYLHAAQWAGRLLAGSLYERYYGISYQELQGIDDVGRRWRGARTSSRFLDLCSERAGGANRGNARSVAHTGAIIEQEQILTTHNLAVLVDGLNLKVALQPSLPDLARRCFKWICWRQQFKSADWRSRLHMVKNTAYAWRQMVFFLSLVPDAEIDAFLQWADGHLTAQRRSFEWRFRPALAGLVVAARGGTLDPAPEYPKARRFLAWAIGEHWLLGT